MAAIQLENFKAHFGSGNRFLTRLECKKPIESEPCLKDYNFLLFLSDIYYLLFSQFFTDFRL